MSRCGIGMPYPDSESGRYPKGEKQNPKLKVQNSKQKHRKLLWYYT